MRPRLSHLLTACLIAAAALGGCGDDAADAPVDAPGGDLLDQLRGLPEVASVTEAATDVPGYRFFKLQVDQPVDHDDPDGPHFQQYVSLIHRDAAAPMVMLHTGYGNWYHDIPHQLTWMLQANQIVVEHRFFRGSRPSGGPADWAALTIRQAAADHHRITVALRRLYAGKWLETGHSKGGMTSVYHRRFHPGDIDGTIAYVAPISFGAPDYRYEAHVEALGPAACRQAVRDLQVELLRNRRAMLDQRAAAEAAATGAVYGRVTRAAAVESAVVSLEWAFWQYAGAEACPGVPSTAATDDAVWQFLSEVSGVSSSSDAEIAEFEAYYYQAEAELGYPGTMDEHLDGLTQFGAEAFAGANPVGVTLPPFEPAAMTDVDAWVQAEGERLVFVYGEWDPWSGGMFELGAARDSLRVVASRAPHGADLKDLAAGDREQVLARIAAWTGVTPDPGRLFRAVPPPPLPRPHVPPAILRALQLRARR